MSERGGVQGDVNKGNPGEVARINQVKDTGYSNRKEWHKSRKYMSRMTTVHSKRAGTPLTRPKVPHEGREQKEMKVEGPGGPAPPEQAQKGGGAFILVRGQILT